MILTKSKVETSLLFRLFKKNVWMSVIASIDEYALLITFGSWNKKFYEIDIIIPILTEVI